MTRGLDVLSGLWERARSLLPRWSADDGVTIIVQPDELDGGYIAYLRELPEVASQGETKLEAARNVVDALVSALDAQLDESPQLRDESDDPTATSVHLPVMA